MNWTLFLPEIVQFGITTNRDMRLQVRNGFGPWEDVTTFTEQQLRVPYAINIPLPFTGARIVWNYNTCGLTGGVIIDID